MKKIRTLIVGICTLILALSLTGCGGGEQQGGTSTVTPNDPLTGESNVLVTYFSWSAAGNTQAMANMIAEFTDGEIFRIQPETPYTTNYNDVLDVARAEQNSNARPALAENITQEQLDGYDVIFVGYPVWWSDAPMIIYSFLEANDFSGKTVITFATSGGSGISDSNLRNSMGANFISGLCITNISASSSSERIENWITDLGYHK
jgi:hypothetical protein